MLLYQHMVTGYKQTNQTRPWIGWSRITSVCYEWAKFDQHLSLYCGSVKPKLQMGRGYWFLLESYEFLQKYTWKQLRFLSHWNNVEIYGTFKLFETSVNGNVTFTYITTFHCTSLLHEWFSPYKIFLLNSTVNIKLLLFCCWWWLAN